MSKLGEKVIADRLQNYTALFYGLRYGSQKGKSAIDGLMLTVSKVEQAVSRGDRATLLGRDITSAFNHLRKEGLLAPLELVVN